MRQPRIEIGKKCKWEEIEVNEVFAISGCINILVKTGKNEALYLCRDFGGEHDGEVGLIHKRSKYGSFYSGIFGSGYTISYAKDNMHKLPLSVQRLWKEE